MTLADSIKNVLKHKSQSIFNDIWRDDLKHILMDIGDDVSRMIKSGASSFKNMKKKDFRIDVKGMIDSGADTLLIFKVLPGRIREGFMHFKEDLYEELEKHEDKKQKTIFCLKVFGALTSFTFVTFYSVKKGKMDFSIAGLRSRNAFTQFIVAEIIFKISQLFIQRFLAEVEKDVTDPDELKNIRYFRELLSNRSKFEESDIGQEITGDKSIEIVEKLKTYIMTGKRA